MSTPFLIRIATVRLCLHVQLHTYYNVFMNFELAYSILLNLRLHNNIHVYSI